MKIEYITSNRQKFEEAQHILEDYQLEQISIELTEIQGDRETVVIAKAKEALKILKRPLIVEDVSFCCKALNGLPGPYVKEFLIRLKDHGIYELIHKYEDHSAQAICLAAFIKPGMEPMLFEGAIEGKVVAPRGETKHGTHSWNTIFLPEGFTKTYGEMSLKEISKISMRRTALIKLREYLETHEKIN